MHPTCLIRFFKIVFLLITATILAAEDFGFSADVGVLPTSMGTVGERVELATTLPPFFNLSFEGVQERILTANADMDLYGGPVRGDTSRESLRGRGRAGAALSLGGFRLAPYAAFTAESSSAYTIVRLIQEGSGLPENTSRFMDIQASESIFAPEIGASASFSIPFAASRLSVSLDAYLSPAASWTMDTSRFLTNVGWPTPTQAGIVYPYIAWAVREEELEVTASSWGASASAEAVFGRAGLALSFFGNISRLEYSGVSDIGTRTFVPYKTWDGVTPLDDLPLAIVKAEGSDAAKVALGQWRMEAGASLRLIFMRDLFRLRAAPRVGVSWATFSKDYRYDYLDAGAGLEAEKWIESYGFVRFIISLGL
ncbi:MAG: hypothetical protein A2Z99_07895 [Treponema sp. GWB1_62_6]|nr:MAG: hypothetical protein A2Z99_07895 [Treponema sp. GWB1_62_6]